MLPAVHFPVTGAGNTGHYTTTTTTIEGQWFTCTSSQVESPSSLDINPGTLSGGERVREVRATAPEQLAAVIYTLPTLAAGVGHQ